MPSGGTKAACCSQTFMPRKPKLRRLKIKTGVDRKGADRPLLVAKKIEGEAARYTVKSRTRNAIEHMVDLVRFGGNGECSCEDFEFHMRPKVKLKSYRGKPLRCAHLLAARDQFVKDEGFMTQEEMMDKAIALYIKNTGEDTYVQ